MGGIPAVNGRGERLLLHIGIIDILQSYRWAGRAHHIPTHPFLPTFPAGQGGAGGVPLSLEGTLALSRLLRYQCSLASPFRSCFPGWHWDSGLTFCLSPGSSRS